MESRIVGRVSQPAFAVVAVLIVLTCPACTEKQTAGSSAKDAGRDAAGGVGGGLHATGGTVGLGGNRATGGSQATGGVTGRGGAEATGGKPGTDGGASAEDVPAAGGASGGTPGDGGSAGTGGTPWTAGGGGSTGLVGSGGAGGSQRTGGVAGSTGIPGSGGAGGTAWTGGSGGSTGGTGSGGAGGSGGADGSLDVPAGGTGGTSATGGNSATGGGPGTGGTGTGGAASSGGVVGTGGTVATGGTIGTGGLSGTGGGTGTASLVWEFAADTEGWVGGFSDYPSGVGSGYDLSFAWSSLPQEVGPGGGLRISGNNHSDDLFCFVKREISGLVPGKTYILDIEANIDTNAPASCSGIGGAPGLNVAFKIGASTIEPAVSLNGDNFWILNIDKGNQSQGGADMKVVGHIGNSHDCPDDTYEPKTLSLPGFSVTSSGTGKLWIILGTDSGFEGATTLYYDRISVTLR